MKTFKEYLDQTQEIGTVEQVMESIVYAHGLPQVHPGEMVMFETGELGYVIAIHSDYVEILLLSSQRVEIDTRVTRMQTPLKVKVGTQHLGNILYSDDFQKTIFDFEKDDPESLALDEFKPSFSERTHVVEQLETGVTVVDLLIPLAKGQRQVIVGDRKTGKSNFLFQTIRTQARKGCICIYAAIAKPQLEVQRVADSFKADGIMDNVIMVTSYAGDRAGLVVLVPYIAMTIAERFCDQGKDVLLVLDDLTTHARYYREIMLLAKRFPGRSSYPGDIFYLHSRLLERAGKFKVGSITCLPVAQSILGDLSGYIQSNIMSMTDGHIFFDSDYFDQGRRPAINPFLSVTRVGGQTQTALGKEVGRALRSLLISFEKVKQFRHFQTELNESIRQTFDIGNRAITFLNQQLDQIIPLPINLIIYAALQASFWKNIPMDQMKKEMAELMEAYMKEPTFQKAVDEMLTKSTNVEMLLEQVRQNQETIFAQIKTSRFNKVEAG